MTDEVLDLTTAITNELVDILKDDTILNNILDLSGDVLETGVPGIKLAFSITNKIRIAKFKSFLIGYSRMVNAKNYDTSKLHEKLIKASQNTAYREFIYNTYESAIQAKSVRNTAVLGYVLGLTVLQKENISIKEIILIDALKEMTDFETLVLIDIFNKVSLSSYFGAEDIKGSKYEITDIQFTIEKLKSLRIALRGSGSFEEVESFGKCQFSVTTVDFHNALYSSQVFESEINESLKR